MKESVMELRREFKLKLNRLCSAPFKLDFDKSSSPTGSPNCYNF